MIRALIVLIGLLVSTSAHAEWREARSRNFLVYSEGGEGQLRDFTETLEKFHFVLRTMHNVTREPSPIRLKVFLMKNIDDVQDTLPYPAGGVAGYYEHRARGPIVVGTRGSGGRYSYNVDPESVLLHEYAHHFMYSYFPATYPTWYSEGFAEFWGTTRIGEDDVVEVGRPAGNRFYSFQGNRWVPIDEILAARNYDDMGRDIDLIYAEGWLLLRYLFENGDRSGQLQRYLDLINSGRSYEEAMNEAFGDRARDLDRELLEYSDHSRFPVLNVPFRAIDVGEIVIRELRPAEDALVKAEIRLGQGIAAAQAREFADEIRERAARFPDDAYALGLVAEAERLAGDGAAAMAAVDRLLRIDADNPRGLMMKGVLQFEALGQAANGDAKAWDAARRPILEANRAAPSDPLILEAYYDSYRAQGVLPPAPAQNALFRALQLAPGDEDLRYKVAADFEARDMLREAIHVIRPTALAMRGHGDETERQRREREEREAKWREARETPRETAREMLARLTSKLGESEQAEAQPQPAEVD